MTEINDIKESINNTNKENDMKNVEVDLDKDLDVRNSVKCTENSYDLDKENADLEIRNKDVKIIPITNLYTWFVKYRKDVLPVKNVLLDNIGGMNPGKFLLLSYPLNELDVDGERDLFLLKNPGGYPVLELNPISMKPFRNGVKIQYEFDDGILYTYSNKANIMVVFAEGISDKIYPYHVEKLHRDENVVIIPEKPDLSLDIENIKLSDDMKETVAASYTKIKKSVENMNTVGDVMNWFQEIFESVVDLNHLLKMEESLCGFVKSVLNEDK